MKNTQKQYSRRGFIEKSAFLGAARLGKLSEKGKEAMSKLQLLQDKLEEMIEYNSTFTHWLVL